MAKHYIRIDEDKIVVHAFSDAFEQPADGDILVDDAGGRHFNPPITDALGRRTKKWDGSKVVDRTAAEIEPLGDLRARVGTRIKAEARRRLGATDWQVLRHRDQKDAGSSTSLTDLDYQDLLAARQAVRDKSDALEAQAAALSGRDTIEGFEPDFS